MEENGKLMNPRLFKYPFCAGEADAAERARELMAVFATVERLEDRLAQVLLPPSASHVRSHAS